MKQFNRFFFQRTVLFLYSLPHFRSFPSSRLIFTILYPVVHLVIHHQGLEGALRHPGDNRTQIRELGQTLIDGGILDELISEKLEAFNSRYEQLNQQVRR